MTDVLTREQRRFNMAQIKSKNTRPEMMVRTLLHALGYRFRLHVQKMAGRPDVVLPKFKAVIFVHGCFWHMHHCKFGKVVPKTNAQFWQIKRMANVERDKRQRKALRKDWSVLTVWECETRNPDSLGRKLRHFLEGRKK